MISTNFLEYYGIVGAVPKGWKKLISEYGRLHDIKNDIVDRLKSDKKPCKYFYKLYLENIKESPVRSQSKWVQELGVQIDDWRNIYSSPFETTRNIKLQNFQFKLPHRITATNFSFQDPITLVNQPLHLAQKSEFSYKPTITFSPEV